MAHSLQGHTFLQYFSTSPNVSWIYVQFSIRQMISRTLFVSYSFEGRGAQDCILKELIFKPEWKFRNFLDLLTPVITVHEDR